VHDIGTLIWVVILLIGVGSSVVKSVKQQNAKLRQAQPGSGAPPAPPPAAPYVRVAGMPDGLHAQFAASATPVGPAAARPRPPAAQPPPPAPKPVQATPPVPARPTYVSSVPAAPNATPPPHLPVTRDRPARAARLFGSRSAVLRSIIASEILGKPRALRDEY
jgi:hypothetical protein